MNRRVNLFGIVAIFTMLSGTINANCEDNRHCRQLFKQVAAFWKAGDYEHFIPVARQEMSNCSSDWSLRIKTQRIGNIGNALVQAKNYEDAIPVLKRCIALDHENPSCWVELGEAHAFLGKCEEAISEFQKTLQIGSIDQLTEADSQLAKFWLDAYEKDPNPQLAHCKALAKGARLGVEISSHTFGTGFFVSEDGHVLTNNHVVRNCKVIATREGHTLRVVDRNASSDLALLQADYKSQNIATFRGGPPPVAGETVIAFGFPLPDILSSEGNVSSGILSATAGLGDDVRFIQISAPVQPGNSGGPLFDSTGNVIGVVVSKLDALKLAKSTGDLAQNVNFAVHWAEIRAFLDEEGVAYKKARSGENFGTPAIATAAKQISVAIDCTN